MVKKQKASALFAKVDPHLTVIDGGRHRRSQQNWKASGGAVCPRCGEEAVRFRVEDGICRRCADLSNDKYFKDIVKQKKQRKLILAHNARIKKRAG